MKSHPRTLLATLPLLLAACGPPNQDGGNPAALSGLAVDGYVAGATVYLDINGNAVLDAYEPRALTDQDGRFGIAADGTRYCNSGNSLHAKHCLRTGEYDGMLLRIEGGIDTLSGETFEGVLSRPADAGTDQITSPLTSLLGEMSAGQISAFLSGENAAAGTGLTRASLDSNPLDFGSNTDRDDNHLIRTAWLLHKSATVIAAELKRRYTDAEPNNQALANDYTPYVYRAMVPTWEAAGRPDLQTFLNTGANITDLITNAGYGATALIEADGGVNDGGAIAGDMTTRIADLVSLIDDTGIFTLGSTAALDRAGVEARGRAIEVLTLMLSQPSLSGNEAAAIADLTNAATLTNLESTAADVGQISADYVASGTATTDYSGRADLNTALAGAGINGTTPTTLTDGSGGSADLTLDTSTGTVNIDISSVDIDGDGNLDTVSLPGTITTVNDYTSMMTLEILGSEQTVILQTDAAGNLVIDTSTMTLEGVDLGTFAL